jgi:hypothetical protein
MSPLTSCLGVIILMTFSVLGQSSDDTCCVGECCDLNLMEYMGYMVLQKNQPLVTSPSQVDHIMIKLCKVKPFTLQLWQQNPEANLEDGSNCFHMNNYTLMWEYEVTPNNTIVDGSWVRIPVEPFILQPTYRLGFDINVAGVDVFAVPFERPGEDSNIAELSALAISTSPHENHVISDTTCTSHVPRPKRFDKFVDFCFMEADKLVCHNLEQIPPSVVTGPPGAAGPPGKNGAPGPAGPQGECCNNGGFDGQGQDLAALCAAFGISFDVGDAFSQQINELSAKQDEMLKNIKDYVDASQNSQGGGVITGRCPSGWVQTYGLGDCFMTPTLDRGSWAQALIFCREPAQMKSNVIDILTDFENHFLANQIFLNMPEGMGKISYWTSAMYSTDEDEWFWRVSSEGRIKFNFYNWKTDTEGNVQTDFVIGKKDANCVALTVEKDPVDGAMHTYWEIKHCKDQAYFFCKAAKQCF